ncbi:MAG: hypothetical protein ABSH47_14855 [Bryobacteraceae bacterium]|jgi:hypothetical protein
MAAIEELLYSHDELRAALIVAGRKIRKLSFGRRNDPTLGELRDVLRRAHLAEKRSPD